MNKLNARLRRIFSDVNLLVPYIVVALINFIVIGLLGIYGGFNSYTAKRAQISTMTSLKETMQTKLAQLKEVDKDYREASQYLENLDTVMPKDPAVSNYLTTLVLSMADKGFSLKNFSVTTADAEGVAHVKIVAVGDPKKGSDLLASIETLKRIGNVTTVSLSYDADTANISCFFDIYYMGDHL